MTTLQNKITYIPASIFPFKIVFWIINVKASFRLWIELINCFKCLCSDFNVCYVISFVNRMQNKLIRNANFSRRRIVSLVYCKGKNATTLVKFITIHALRVIYFMNQVSKGFHIWKLVYLYRIYLQAIMNVNYLMVYNTILHRWWGSNN